MNKRILALFLAAIMIVTAFITVSINADDEPEEKLPEDPPYSLPEDPDNIPDETYDPDAEVAEKKIGDVNANGRINALDVSNIMKHIRKKTPAGFIEAEADYNGDKEINTVDVSKIMKSIVDDPLNAAWETKPENPITVRAEDVEAKLGDAEVKFGVYLENVPGIGASSALVNVKVEGAEFTSVELNEELSGYLVGGALTDAVTFMWTDVDSGMRSDSRVVTCKLKLPEGAKKGDKYTIVVTVDAAPENFISFDEVDGAPAALGAVAKNGSITVVGGGSGNRIIRGDFTGDGKLNAKDVTALMRAIIRRVAFDNAADFNGDGKVNAKDVTAIMKAIVSGERAE